MGELLLLVIVLDMSDTSLLSCPAIGSIVHDVVRCKINGISHFRIHIVMDCSKKVNPSKPDKSAMAFQRTVLLLQLTRSIDHLFALCILHVEGHCFIIKFIHYREESFHKAFFGRNKLHNGLKITDLLN